MFLWSVFFLFFVGFAPFPYHFDAERRDTWWKLQIWRFWPVTVLYSWHSLVEIHNTTPIAPQANRSKSKGFKGPDKKWHLQKLKSRFDDCFKKIRQLEFETKFVVYLLCAWHKSPRSIHFAFRTDYLKWKKMEILKWKNIFWNPNTKHSCFLF